MKFKNITDIVINCYGYCFAPGVPVEVTEDSLCNKFSRYNTLEEVSDAVQEQGPEAGQESPDEAAAPQPVDRAALKAQADALGIQYHAKVRTTRLQKLIADHGNEN